MRFLRNIKSKIKITGDISIEPNIGMKRLNLFKAGVSKYIYIGTYI